MRIPIHAVLLLVPAFAAATEVTLHVEAPGHEGKGVYLLRYDDLFTRRSMLLDQAVIDSDGRATVKGSVEEVNKGFIRIGHLRGELYLVPGITYHVHFGQPPPGTATSISGNTVVPLRFQDIDPFDLNALVSDLNMRLDAFLAADLATDREGGMRAAEVLRREPVSKADSLRRPPTVFLTPQASKERIDTLEQKLASFYADATDAWFLRYMELAVGGLRIGPRTSRKWLHEHYLAGREPHYGDPEYVRFIRNLFEDHFLAEPFRRHEARLKQAIREQDLAALDELLRDNVLLAEDDALRELVMIDQLYLQYHGKLFHREGMLGLLRQVEQRSTHQAHRSIAGNMVWDLTAMRPGATLPSLALRDTAGSEVLLDSLLEGPVCLAFTAAWCGQCATELRGLAALTKEYGPYLRWIVVSLDPDADAMQRERLQHPPEWTWLHAGDDPQVMDALRLRSLPVFMLLNGTTLARAPADPPSRGLGAMLHPIRVQAEQDRKYDPTRGVPMPPPR
jgi:hypothetical protein